MKRKVKIGLTLVVGIVSVYIFVAWANSMHFFAAVRNSYIVQFDNVAGLKPGDPVTVYGVPSGNVSSISLGNGGAEVEISMDKEVNVQTDAFAEIQIKEIMGGKLLVLDPGKSGVSLPESGRIQGKTSMDFSTAFSRFGTMMDDFDMAAMDTMIQTLNEVAHTFNDLSKSFDQDEMGNTFSTLAETAESMNRILKEVEQRQLIVKVDSAMASVTELSKKADSTLGSFNQIASKVENETLPKSDSLLTTMVSMLDQTESMLTGVEDLLEQMQNENTAAGKMLYDESFAETIDSTLHNLNRTLEHVRRKKLHVTMSLTGKQKVFEE